MANNKIKIEIVGTKYYISTPEEEPYVLALAGEIDEKVQYLLENGKMMSVPDALVLVVMHYIDLYKKSEINADNLRSQLTGYLEDAARARIEVDELKHEILRLKSKLELKDLR